MPTLKELDSTVNKALVLSLQLREYLRKDAVTKSIDRHIIKMRRQK